MLRRILASALLCAAPAFAQTHQTIEVTATRIAEDVLIVPASITVIDADELRARNATDLASALALASGINATGGSDAGPGAGVPEMWGLREVDAFLLVVDGVPWGGAFNPDLPAIDLTGVDRIEIVRGSAPVIFGATSFVGVIHIIHTEAGSGDGQARLSLGSFGSGSASVSLPLTQSTTFRQSLIAGVERRGFRDDESQYDRGHVLYRAGSGNFRFDADATLVRQAPSSPHVRQGPVLSTRVPLDANHNPSGAKLDENRIQLNGGWSSGNNAVTLAITRSTFDITRGFLARVSDTAPNAFGFSQDRTVTDVYFDAHTVRQFHPQLRVIAGLDHLFGDASAESRTFDYFVPLAGGPTGVFVGDDEEHRVDDRRNFCGVYAQAEYSPSARLRFDAGLRLNHTRETRNDDSRTVTRPSGSVGVNYRVTNALALFADYRNTYKPAAIDFGPESDEGEILEPEEAQSIEIGAKGAVFGDRLEWQTSAFAMNFENLVVPNVRNGLPVLENAGNERFTGAELEVDYRVLPALRTQFAYSYHDARFRDYVRAFDGVPTQLSGRRFEMSPLHMAAAGFTWEAGRGLTANAYGNYVGERYLTKRNTARAAPYTTWSAGLGWRLHRGELRVDGRNLSNARPPVAESELGDGQYYRLSARTFEVSYRLGF